MLYIFKTYIYILFHIFKKMIFINKLLKKQKLKFQILLYKKFKH